jgi:Ca-activated chloride channel family protein
MLPDLAALEHFHFLRPAFALLLLPIIAVAVAQRRRSTQRDRFGGIIAPHLLEHLRLSRYDNRWFNPVNASLVVTALVLVVLMGPSWRQQPSPLSQDEAALVVLLDVSQSMEQRDIQPSRLRRAKQKISDLLALRPDKKASLVVYAGSAHTVLSLTADQDILNQYLAAIRPGVMPRPGKYPEYALPLVDEVLRQSNAPASVVLFADGVGAGSAEAFRQYFDERPHQLLVVGVGSEEDTEGVAPLERRSLEQLASNSGGRYVSLTVDGDDMRQVSRRVDSHYIIVEDSALPWLDSGYPLVFPAMALFLLWFRKGWTLTWSWVLLPLVLAGSPQPALAQANGGDIGQDTGPVSEQASTQATGDRLAAAGQWFVELWLTGDQQGRLLMQLGDYSGAAKHFTDPMWKGLAFYYNEDFMLAADYFSRTDSDDALFNEANARAHARDYVRAVQRYDRLLARTPDYPGARHNRDRVQAIIDDINRMSESQMQEPGGTSEPKELGSDDAIPAQGAEEIVFQPAELQQFTAEEILQDPATADMWMRGVQQDPSNFLASKFSMQLDRRAGPAGDAP